MTRSLRAIASFTVSVALVSVAAAVVSAQSPKAATAAASTLFADAVAKESAVRRALAGDMAVPSVLKAVRTVIADYEAVVRRYPSTGFSDDALWRAAKLSREAFDAFHESRERTTAIRLLRQLAAGYPSSRFSPLTAAEMNWLNSNQSVVPAASAARPAVAAPQLVPVAAEQVVKSEPAAISRANDTAPQYREASARLSASAGRTDAPPRLSAVSAVGAPAGLVDVKAVRRTVLPTVVRVIVELDAEVSYRDARLENPTRVFIDIPSTRPNLELIDQTLRFDGDDDIVRQIRIGRHPNNVTRVVLEGAGIASYSIYPLYNPYRLVIDCLRTSSGADAKSDTLGASPALTTALPSYPAPAVRPAAASAATTPVAGQPASLVATPAPSTGQTLPQTASAAPSTASAPIDAGKPAWVETLRRKPGAARSSTPALPPIPTPSLRSKPVSGNVPLPTAGAGSTPTSAAPPTSSPVTADKPMAAQAETVVAATGLAAAATVTTPTATTINATPAYYPAPAAPAATAPAPAPVEVAAAPETLDEDIDAGLPPLATAPAAGNGTRSPKPAERNLAGGLSMARQLGLGVTRIVIDPGHGGHDPGAQSHGVNEADLVLDVSLRLEKLLAKLPGVDVLLTRRTNVFIPLQERPAIANREGADLFLSIHANASNTPSAGGIETYFLNFASNRNAAAVAARENATSGQTMGELQDVVKAIAANNKRDESRDFATYVQRELMNSLKKTDKAARDLGVKQAPFVVLVGAAMPSVLAEISFITNPQEAKLLKQNAYRQRIAQALFEGVRRYQSSLKSPVAVAQQQN